MANDNETIEDIVRELRREPLAENGAKPWVHYLADRIEAAHKREKMHDESLLQKAGATVVGLMNKVNAQNEEASNIRTLVKELADAVSINICDGPSGSSCDIYSDCCRTNNKFRALVARARHMIGGAE